MEENDHQKAVKHSNHISFTDTENPGYEFCLILAKNFADSILEVKFPSGRETKCLVAEFLTLTDR